MALLPCGRAPWLIFRKDLSSWTATGLVWTCLDSNMLSYCVCVLCFLIVCVLCFESISFRFAKCRCNSATLDVDAAPKKGKTYTLATQIEFVRKTIAKTSSSGKCCLSQTLSQGQDPDHKKAQCGPIWFICLLYVFVFLFMKVSVSWFVICLYMACQCLQSSRGCCHVCLVLVL